MNRNKTSLSTIQLLSELIKIPSDSHNQAQVLRALKFVEKYIKENLNTKKIPLDFQYLNNPKCHNLIVKPKKVQHPKLTLYSHIDVVKANSINQYTPTISQGKIYGRGAGDMKCGTAIEIQSFITALQANPDASLALMIVGDEEIGGTNGIKFLLSEHQYRTDCVYMPDSGSGLDTIITDQKGIFFIQVTTKGKSAHGSRSHEGKNAILLAYEIIQDLYSFFEKSDPKKYRSTISLSQINGGRSFNSVPDKCEFTIDIRFTDIKDVNKVMQYLDKKKDTSFETLLFDKNFYVDKNNPALQLYQKISEKVLKSKVAFKFEHGGSDGRFFQNYNIPCIIMGIKKANTHGENEWADVKEIQQGEVILNQFIEEYLQ